MSNHPWARIGGPPEQREWFADPSLPSVPPRVHASSTVQSFVTVDSGTRRATTIGARTVLMAKAHVGHDAIVGDDCEIAPNSTVCGWAEIGDGVRIGANACILPYRKVGNGARVGAGAVVTKDIPPAEVWAGNPARKLEDHERDPRPHTERRASHLDEMLDHWWNADVYIDPEELAAPAGAPPAVTRRRPSSADPVVIRINRELLRALSDEELGRLVRDAA